MTQSPTTTHLMTLSFDRNRVAVEDAMDDLLADEHRAAIAMLTGLVFKEFEVTRDYRSMTTEVRIFGTGGHPHKSPWGVKHRLLVKNYMLEKGLYPDG